jgi:hypothetical protein
MFLFAYIVPLMIMIYCNLCIYLKVNWIIVLVLFDEFEILSGSTCCSKENDVG